MTRAELSAEEFSRYRAILDMRYAQLLYVAREVGRDDTAKLGVSTNPQKRRRNINTDAVAGRIAVYWQRPLFLREYVMPLCSPKPTYTWTERWVHAHLAEFRVRHDMFPNGANEWFSLSPLELVERVKALAQRYDVVHLESPTHYAAYIAEAQKK